MSLQLSDFRIQSALLELRYPKAFQLWDSAGMIAVRLQRSFPKLALDDAKPNAQRFNLGDKLSAEIKIDRAHIAEFYPDSNLDKLRTGSDAFCETLNSALDFTEFERIGLRLFFEKTFDSREGAAEYLASATPAVARSGKYFNIDGGHLLDGDISFRWEGETLGIRVQVLSQEKTLEIASPPEFPEVNTVKSKKRMVLVDVDYYAHSSTPVSKFKASAVLESWLKVIKRDLEGFINA